jgi:hypothetical protein
MKADDRLDIAQKEFRAAREEERQLKQQADSGGNEAAQEKEIRDTLKMARPNEVVIIIPEEVLASLPSGAPRPQDEGEKGSNFSQWLKVFGF